MDFSELAGLAGGHAGARAVQVALKLGLFEALEERALEARDLAARIACDVRATTLLANAIVALRILEKRGERYGLTPDSARYLLVSSPEYLGGMILFDEAIFPLWARLEESVRGGAPARAPDMFQSRPDETRSFIHAMDSLVRARGDARYVAAKLDLSGVRSLADVGGGPGTYALEFVQCNAQLKAAILDLPATLAVTREILAGAPVELTKRIELIEFDYRRDPMPAGFDAAFLSNIIHSEDVAANQALVRNCYQGLNRDGMVIIKDHVMNAALTEPPAGAIFSLYLLLTTNGRDYSFEEIGGWLREAGFVDIMEEPLPSPPFSSSLVTARKA